MCWTEVLRCMKHRLWGRLGHFPVICSTCHASTINPISRPQMATHWPTVDPEGVALENFAGTAVRTYIQCRSSLPVGVACDGQRVLRRDGRWDGVLCLGRTRERVARVGLFHTTHRPNGCERQIGRHLPTSFSPTNLRMHITMGGGRGGISRGRLRGR